MNAAVLGEFGGIEKLEIREIRKPEPGVGELQIKVIASATNPVDAKIRASGYWARLTPPVVLGYDAAGVIEEIGPGVSDFSIGEEVYFTPEIAGNAHGTYAEYTVVPASIVARKPSNLTFEEAAAIPLAGGTAWEAIVRRLALRPGETVLIHGGAGGVGSFAVQFARATGAMVIASASAANQNTLHELGAHCCIDYEKQNGFELIRRATNGMMVDAAFDIQGPDLVARCLPVVRPGGRIACILPPQGDLTELYQKNITLHGVFLTRERKRLEEMSRVFERGQAIPLVDRVLPLEKVGEAHKRLETGHGRGKWVLKIA